MLIESVVDKESDSESHGLGDEMCSVCEMAVVWMQNQLKRNQTQEMILDYINQVQSKFNLFRKCFSPFMFWSLLLKIYSSVIGFPARWVNHLSTAMLFLRCPMFPLPLVVKNLLSPRNRFDTSPVLFSFHKCGGPFFLRRIILVLPYLRISLHNLPHSTVR